ncbi:MAG: SMC-Scp complex subunit ScpB [Defluviitaleaceae bacterium]|nr:SMC-Scp complex subunit ScpB [Defluviitaleaceae bacterium]
MSIIYEKSIEAILFAAGEPVSISDIADALEINESNAQQTVANLAKKYKETNSGILITESDGHYQMHTNPLYFDAIKKLYEKPKKKALTQTLMETLAIIAFKQPISRPQIEEIRGVSADHAVNRLLDLNLVEECGRLNIPGKPVAFGTTREFLRHFGFNNLEEMLELVDITALIDPTDDNFTDEPSSIQEPNNEQVILEDI